MIKSIKFVSNRFKFFVNHIIKVIGNENNKEFIKKYLLTINNKILNKNNIFILLLKFSSEKYNAVSYPKKCKFSKNS